MAGHPSQNPNHGAHALAIGEFLDYLSGVRGVSPNTREAYGRDLLRWFTWLDGRGLEAGGCSMTDLLQFVGEERERGLSGRSVARLLSVLRSYYGYLTLERGTENDPTRDMDSPRIRRPLPVYLSFEEVEQLLNQPDTTSPRGLKDRTILEVLYAAGLRVSELVGLHLNSCNLMAGFLRVTGKGNKERLVPFGQTAREEIESYLEHCRPLILKGRRCNYLFVTGRAGTGKTTFLHSLKKESSKRMIVVAPTGVAAINAD